MSMANEKETVTLRVQELARANSVTLAALVQILEEKGVSQQAKVLERVRVIRNRQQPRRKSQHC